MSFESPTSLDILNSKQHETMKANLAWEVIRNIGELGDKAQLLKMRDALERLDKATK